MAMSTTAAAAASFGNPDEPPQGAINAKNPASVTDPGPQNPAIRDQFPSAFSPPATDVGSMPQIWASFNNAPRRIQDGGWARQVTQADFPISKTISGVNMRAISGIFQPGIRIPCRALRQTVANSSSASTMARRASSTPFW
jgi:oxalate decarboxylase